MIHNTIKLLPLSDIIVERTVRQRTDLTPESVFTLACDIAQHGLLQNIGVTPEHKLIFGERRYTAFRLIQDVLNGEPPISPDQVTELLSLIDTKQYQKWTVIPVRVCVVSSAFALGALEYIENSSRSDLSWQDQAAAAAALHKLAVAEAKAKGELWSEAKTAQVLGMDRSQLNRLLAPLRQLETATEVTREKVKEAIQASTSPLSAANAITAIKERHNEPVAKRGFLTSLAVKPQAAPPKLPPSEQVIHQADFNAWAPNCPAPFNFLHFDPPYGISFNSSGGQATSAATKQVGTYDDGEDVYFSLLQTLLSNREKLLTESAHIMLWFSQNHRRATEDLILRAWPDAVISKFLLIWHCTDNAGLLPAPQYEGRRNLETAMQITLGGRKLASPKSLVFGHPRNAETKIHRSLKPVPVLEHFLAMYVDTSTHMLDPTAGSGSALIASKKLGAPVVMGLELDAEMAAAANEYYGKMK